MGRQSILKEFPGRSALLAAGAQDSPDSRVPLSAHQRTAALRDPAVDYGSPNATLGNIVGRRDSWIEQESENCFPVLDQPSGQSSRPGTLAKGLHLCQPLHAVFDPQHNSIKPLFGNLLPQMPEVKQSFEINQQTFSKLLVSLVRQRGQ